MEMTLLFLAVSLMEVKSYPICLDFIDDLCQTRKFEDYEQQLSFYEPPKGWVHVLQPSPPHLYDGSDFPWIAEESTDWQAVMPLNLKMKKLDEIDLELAANMDREDHIKQTVLEGDAINTDSEITIIEGHDFDSSSGIEYKSSDDP